jgi:cell wall-associated NlpC family hydrolase
VSRGSRSLPLWRSALYAALALAAVVAAVAIAVGGGGRTASHARGPAAAVVLPAPVGAGSGGRAGTGSAASAGVGSGAGASARSGAGASVGSPGTANAAPGSGGRAAARSGSEAAGRAVAVAEVRDPEEARSFPLPASTRHAAASTPEAAGEAAIAPGAASDSQIRKELGEEAQARAQERAAQQRVLMPVPGGSSVGGNGSIPIPTNAPEAVQRVIAGGNAIADFPYIWGGGHASFVAGGYDCSGSVSYALAAGGLLSAPLVSGELANWGDPGPGRWITIYANAGHTFMDVDGVWFDTAGRSGPYASRWLLATPPLEGYAVRHPPGY